MIEETDIDCPHEAAELRMDSFNQDELTIKFHVYCRACGTRWKPMDDYTVLGPPEQAIE